MPARPVSHPDRHNIVRICTRLAQELFLARLVTGGPNLPWLGAGSKPEVRIREPLGATQSQVMTGKGGNPILTCRRRRKKTAT